jgi:hypothetical protein
VKRARWRGGSDVTSVANMVTPPVMRNLSAARRATGKDRVGQRDGEADLGLRGQLLDADGGEPCGQSFYGVEYLVQWIVMYAIFCRSKL